MVNSKQKGNRAELELAKLLTATTGKQFSRVGVSSGARKGFGNVQAEEVFAGDIITPPDCRFCIEVKSGYAMDGGDFFPNVKPKIKKFFEQAKRDAKRIGKIPMLCCKLRGGVWVVVLENVPTVLCPDCGFFTDEFMVCLLKDIVNTLA